jgi:hypothetical protein
MPTNERILGGTADTVSHPTTQGLEGLEVSLNLPRRSLFGLPGTNFELTKSKPTGKLPHTLTMLQNRQITRALHLGELIPGPQPVVRKPQHPEALKGFFVLLGTPNMQQVAIEQMINGIVNTPDGDPKIGNYSRFEVLEMLFESELKQQARAPVLEYLTKAKDFVPGHEGVVDEPVPMTRKKSEGGRTPITSSPPSPEDLADI